MSLYDDITADLADAVYDTDGHALSVSYNGSTVPALVHYDGHLEDMRGANAQHAVLQVSKANVASWAKRDTVVFDSNTWRVKNLKMATRHEWWLFITRDERPSLR